MKKMNRILISALFAGGVAGFAAAPAPAGAAGESAAATPWAATDQTKVRLVSAKTAVDGQEAVQLGLQFKLKENWKIYWRTPGDAGYPPRLDWKDSANLKQTEFAWPAPVRFSVLGFETTGYKKEVVFPINARVENPTEPLKLRAKLDYLACDDVCIPYQTNFSFDLPAGNGETTDHAHLIGKYLSRVPGDGSAHGIKIETAVTGGDLGPVKDDFRKGLVRVTARSDIPFKTPDIFVEGPDTMIFFKPDIEVSEGGTVATARIPVDVEEGFKLQQANLTFTLTDGGRAAEQPLTVERGEAEPSGGPALPLSLPVILGLALIGGLILNLMPCVLPVISLKVLGVISHGGGEKRAVRTSFLATSAGIVFSFLAIAAGLVSLKLAGSAVGWGIQFQHPWFLVALTIIVTLFAYNLWGMFEINLPAGFAGALGGPQQGDQHSIGGNFATGAFATLLATPCSAPFLGTAVGFALAGSIADTFAVFAALGIGMALPFLVIAGVPALATKLPKPGAWMVRVKQFMGLALAATTLWLLSVLAVQVSPTAAVIIGIIMAAIGVILWMRSRMAETGKRAAMAGLAAAMLAAFLVPGQVAPRAELNTVKEAYWAPFEPERIPRLVAEGKTVFVDVTAEWCITCQVNKATVLNRGAVNEFLAGDDVIAMQGDWTRPDETISKYLAGFNRFGIPFNAVYGPGAEKGVVLPELLTAGIVLGGIEKASGGVLAAK